MKKLMVTMLAVFAFATAHAAQISWGTGTIQGAKFGAASDANPWVGKEVMFFFCTSDFDPSTIITAINNEQNWQTLTGVGSQETFAATFKVQNVANVMLMGGPTSGLTIVDNGTYYGFGIIFDGNGNVAISVRNTITVAGGTGNTSFGTDANWTIHKIEIIPEPATALLALAGIGLLIAQKRKRA